MGQKRRYVVFRVSGGGWDDVLEYVKNLEQACDEKSAIKLVEFDPEAGLGVLRCGHLQLKELKSKRGARHKTKIAVIGVSGTLKAAKRKFMTKPQAKV